MLAGLIPLRIAARVAYLQLTHTLRQAAAEKDLERIAPLVAVALATVTPIRRPDGTALSDHEVRERLYPPRSDAALDGLAIRRADLKAALRALRDARRRSVVEYRSQ